MELVTSLLLCLTTLLGVVLFVVRRLLASAVPVKGTTNIPGPTEGKIWPLVGDALWLWRVKNMSEKSLPPNASFMETPKKVVFIPLRKGLKEIKEIKITTTTGNNEPIQFSDATVYLFLKKALQIFPGTQQIEDTMNFSETINKVIELLFKRILRIEYKIDWVYHLSSLGRLDLTLKEDLRPILKEMVDKCFKNVGSTGRNPADPDFVPENFIEVVIQACIRENKTEEEMVFSFLDLIVAGFDTTSVVISTTLLFLAMHPEYQEEAYQEQMEVMKDSLEAPSREELSRMNYLEMSFNETLRHVSVPAIVRTISAEFTVDGYIFPEGASLYIMYHHLFKNPEYWERPDDFYPDHFLPEKVATRPKGAFLPFSFGGRSCPGKLFGVQSSKLVLSMLLRRYKFTTSLEYEEMVYKYMLMVESEKGYPLEVTARANLTDTARVGS